MNADQIFDLIQKGLTVIGTVIEAGQSAAPALDALQKLVTGAKTGSVTSEQLAQTEAVLDTLIENFNAEI
jgi:hypothetical protein